MRVVVRVGGSVVGSPLNASLIGKYVDLLKTLKDEGNDVVAVVGGGSLAREFIKVIAGIGLKESSQDWAAIHVSRVYAHLLLIALNEANPSHVPISIDEIDNLLKKGRIVIMGGL